MRNECQIIPSTNCHDSVRMTMKRRMGSPAQSRRWFCPPSRRDEREDSRGARLAFHVDRDRLCEFEGETSLGGKFDVFFPGEIGRSHSGSCPDGPADQGAFTASCDSTDQQSTTRAAAHPGKVPFVVVSAYPMGRGSPNFVILTINLNRLQCQQQSCPTHQPSRVVRINHQSLDASTLRDDRLVCNDDRPRNGCVKVIPRSALIAGECLIQGHVYRCLFC